MKKLMTAGLSLSAVLTALGEVKAYVNYPWCIIGDTRGIDCVGAWAGDHTNPILKPQAAEIVKQPTLS